jgi:hypothetical protein
VSVNGRRFTALAVVLVAVNVFFWIAQSGFALSRAGGIIQQILGGRMIRAEVVWQTPSGAIQDTRIDRGVVMSVTQDQIVLREKDGSMDAIPLAPNATVTLGARTGTVAQLRRGLRVIVSRTANGPADSIQVEGFGA